MITELYEELKEAIDSARTSFTIYDAQGARALPRHSEEKVVDLTYAVLREIPDHWTVADVVSTLETIRQERGRG